MIRAALVILGLLATLQDKPEYSFGGEAFEACECESVCPCVWTKDASFADCRATVVWSSIQGSFGKTDLKGSTFALGVIKSDHNMLRGMGKWEGVLYVSDTMSADQRHAIEKFFRGKWGAAFSKLEVKTVPMETKLEADHKELRMGKIATVKISAIKNADGKVPAIENPPFSLYPKLYCAKADVNTYDDGSKWDFSGRNAFYGPFEYSSK
ncbi:MAG TPA: DUF1326 domain-containing protein [Planctomycetota bacterium]|nr:DUF1326 domain-containing protein [Planctomycetota bacterium]